MSDNQTPVLAVDLDQTLLRNDMLHETFWSAVARDWRVLFRVLPRLGKDRAMLKEYLAEVSEVDVATLPYSRAVIELIEGHRASGGRTALVTASDARIAQRIADHLGLFDEVQGSHEGINLKAERKAEALNRLYGMGGYIYVGDSSADLVIWPDAVGAVTVNAARKVTAQDDALDLPCEHMEEARAQIRDYLKAMRPHQWLKNLLVFLPMVMITAQAFTVENLIAATGAFVAFSLVASSVYLLNDLMDLAADRAHPRKRNRPLAAGRIPIAHGTALAIGLLSVGLILSALVGPLFLLVILAYYAVTLAYSLNLKRRTVLDICVLAGLYTIRIIAGGAATGITLSVWLMAFSIFLFFSLAAVKRLAELVDNRDSGRANLTGRGYVVDDIPMVQSMAVGAGYVSVLVMALYVNAPVTVANYSTPEALWGICCVLLYWISRTIFLAHRGFMEDDPVIYAVKDRISLICLGFVFTFGLIGALW